MFRVAGIKNNRIQVVSTSPITSTDLISLTVPETLDHLSNADLMLQYRIKDQQFVLHKGSQPATQCKVALVGNYKMQCGISTYNENLWPAIISQVKEAKLFIEHNDQPTSSLYQLGSHTLTDAQVSVCWKRNEPHSQLVQQIKDYDPDVILISHEWGIFPNARHWLSLLTQLSDYRIIVILHSVFPEHQDKTIAEAAIPEIIVHLPEAKTALQTQKHIHAPISVIPHGCYPAINITKLWNLYRSPHTFIHNGFGHHYKRFETSIQAVAHLKERYPNVFLTILFSESPHNKVGHQSYYEELIRLIDQLGVQEQVGIVRGFLSDEVMDAYLRTNKVAVFPYMAEAQHKVFGSSGAARLAMSKGIPVISSTIPHFSDLPTIKIETAQQLADQLGALFDNPVVQQQQIDLQLKFIESNSWENVAKKVVALFESGLILSEP